MRICKMTATFGSLEQRTLSFEPGMNVIEAPNEWGKSTWCAFLIAMLYGISTSERTKQGHLADKERFAPWSGAAMSGAVELVWNDREITIERSANRRTPMGQFRAYETHTGLPVPELTADNCGQVLLGVEQDVFTRVGFIRFRDLPVSQNEDLRRRLNALVTTGDESSTAQKLERQLRDLKNRCRHNKTGILPQLEGEKERIDSQLAEQSHLNSQVQHTSSQLEAVDVELQSLENHRLHLIYEESLQKQAQVDAAREQAKALSNQEALLAEQCRNLQSQQQLDANVERIDELCRTCRQLQVEADALQHNQIFVQVPEAWSGKDRTQVLEEAEQDQLAVKALEAGRRKQNRIVPVCIAALTLVAVAVGWVLSQQLSGALLWGGAALLAATLASGLFLILRTRSLREKLQILYDRHPGVSPGDWKTDAENLWERFEASQKAEARASAVAAQLADIQKELDELTGGGDPEDAISQNRRDLLLLRSYAEVKQKLQTAQEHLKMLEQMLSPVSVPAAEDHLTLSLPQTQARKEQLLGEREYLQLELGRHLGKLSAFESAEDLQRQSEALKCRIAHLEEIYNSIILAQEALQEAEAQLQRRFAPQISARAATLFRHLTGGRYSKLSLGQDLEVSAAAEDENVLRSALWRSDGTIDQLYLALRIAVAEALTPNAPLILDDALVRFDDTRLKAAMELLKQEAQDRQVILFTCHSREKSYM